MPIITINTTSAFKIYRAIITQSGFDAPVATVLENTLGGTVIWSRNAPGEYSMTLNGAFTANKTFIIWPPYGFTSNPGDEHFIFTPNVNTIRWGSYASGSGLPTLGDDLINQHPIEIRIYT